MVGILIHGLTLALLARNAVAFPSTAPVSIPFTPDAFIPDRPAGLGRYDWWQAPAPANRSDRILNALSPRLDKRQDMSECDLGGTVIHVQDENAPEGQRPQAFSILWDRVFDTICSNPLICNNDRICTLATRSSQICVTADGDFDRGDREIFLGSAREIFDRTVIYSYNPNMGGFNIWQGGNEFATSEVVIRRRGGNGQIGVFFEIEELPEQCDQQLEQVASIGGLFTGGAAGFFGLIGLICGGEFSGRTI